MSYWSNIEVSTKDSEINEIDDFGRGLGDLSESVQKVRELIRRFEVCHFKRKTHLEYIVDSIMSLNPSVEPAIIGANHISKGLSSLKRDTTGRSKLGQQYVCSLKSWLGDNSQQDSEYFNSELSLKIEKWLDAKDPQKERLVKLLVSRLMWDWSSYKQYQSSENPGELESQVCRMDICHYAFPGHLELLLEGIGQSRPIENFEGCGTFDTETREYIEKQYVRLCERITGYTNTTGQDKEWQIKVWLMASLAKTLKEQVGLNAAMPRLK